MSVIKVVPVIGQGLSVDRQNVHEFEEPFNVIVTPGTSPLTVLRHPDVPKPYNQHPEFPAAYAGKPTIEQENLRLYRVDVPYTTKLEPGEKRGGIPDNPLAKPVSISVRSTTVRELIQTDWEGYPLVNTAGDLIQGVEEDETLWQITAVKNVPPVIPSWFEDYGNAINKDSVRVRGKLVKKNQLKITGIELPDSEYDNGVEYISLSISALYRKKNWERQFLNYGLRERKRVWNADTEKYDDTGIGPVVIDGEAVTEPVPLDKDGRAFRDYLALTDPPDVIEYITQKVSKSDIESNLLKYKTRPVLSFRRLGVFQ